MVRRRGNGKGSYSRLGRIRSPFGVGPSDDRPSLAYAPVTRHNLRIDRVSVGPHEWGSRGWRFWICRHCYNPKQSHPQHSWAKARSLHDNRWLNRYDAENLDD